MEARGSMNAAPDKPYGDVEYADPGYQDDGKARYPLDSPDHVRSAWDFINQQKNASLYGRKHLDKIKDRIMKACKKMGIEVAPDAEPDADPDDGMRATHPDVDEIMRYDRLWALDDIEIVRGGDGRHVHAYAAVFDSPAEIRDQHGHYREVIARSAFNRAISHGIERVNVLYNHGYTAAGTPSDLGSVPIGSPVEIKPDGRGLFTVTRFNKSQLADSVLEAIRNGDIKGYSFRGRIFQSTPDRVPRGHSGELPTITRTELGLSEYGPTHAPYYADAGIVAVRSIQEVKEHLRHLDMPADVRDQIFRALHEDNATPTTGPGAEDPPEQALRSASTSAYRRRIAVARILGEVT